MFRSMRSEQDRLSENSQKNVWEVTGDGHEYRISRRYKCSSNNLSQDEVVQLEILCIVRSSDEVNSIVTHMQFRIHPLQPYEESLVLGLFTKEPKGALVEVEVLTGLEKFSAPDDLAILTPHKEDIPKLLRALFSGHELQFLIAPPASPEQPPHLGEDLDFLASGALANDISFKALYEQAWEDVATCQDATRARQLGEGWYRRRTPGLYFK